MSHFPAEMVTTAAQQWSGVKTFLAGVVLATLTSMSMAQGGTLVAPQTEYPIVFQPRDPAYGTFGMGVAGTTFNTTVDYTFDVGYNLSGAAGLPIIRWTAETDYEGTPGEHSIECHGIQATLPTGWHGLASGFSWRAIATNAFGSGPSAGIANTISQMHSSGAGTGYFQYEDASDGSVLVRYDRNQFRFNTPTGAAPGVNGSIANFVADAGGPAAAMICGYGSDFTLGKTTGSVGYWNSLGFGATFGAMYLAGATNTQLWIGRMSGDGGNRRELLSIDHLYKGIQLFSFGNATPCTTDFGGGVGVLGISNATTPPTADAAAGGILWVSGGDLHYRSGNVVLATTRSLFLTQGGTLLAPQTERPWSFQPVDPTRPAFYGQMSGTANPFGGSNDYVGEIGWNVNGSLAAEAVLRDSWENYYETAATSAGVSLERHAQWTIPANWLGLGGPLTSGRFFTANAFANGVSNVGLNVTRGGYFYVAEQIGSGTITAGLEYIRAEAGNNGIALKSEGTHALTLQQMDPAKRTTILFKSSGGAAKGVVGYYPAGVLLTQECVLWGSADTAVDLVAYTAGVQSTFEGSTGNLQLFTSGATKDFGGGSGVLGIHNASVVPTTNATNGTIIYAESGAAKVRGASGTITTFGPADPHCPRCGLDFAVEWVSPMGHGRAPDEEEHLAVCFACLTKKLHEHGIDVGDFTIHHKLAA